MQSTAEHWQSRLPVLEHDARDAHKTRANRVRWLKLNFTVKAARLQTLKRQKYQHLQEEALLKARGLLENWENGVVVLTEDLYRRAAGERDAQELMNYTPEALALRFSLRNDPHVLEAVRHLWQIEMTRDSLGCINQRGYASVFRRVAKSLNEKEFKKKQKLDRLLDDDWKRDSKGESSMSFANFFDSIFELADLWCETIDASDYVDFLERLRDRISHVRHGKRVFRPLGKVTAFDDESDDDEEEEEENEDNSEDEAASDKYKKAATPGAVPARLLVAKAIRPAPQPQKQPLNLLGKVTRVAMTRKVIHRKVGTEAAPAQAAKSTATVLSDIVVPTATVPSTAAPSPHAVEAPRADEQVPLPLAVQTPGMVSRQRRASVITTIQFLDDGSVRSVSEGLGNSGSGGLRGSMASAAADALAAAAAYAGKRDQALRPSLATAAAAALARISGRPSGQTLSSESGLLRDDLASISEDTLLSTPSHQPKRGSAERKRVITVSTAKRAMHKSIVFTTATEGSRGVGSGSTNDERENKTNDARSTRNEESDGKESRGETVTHVAIKEDEPSAEARSQAHDAHTSGGAGDTRASTTVSSGLLVRARTVSMFDDPTSTGIRASKGVLSVGPRQGFAAAAAAARARSGLTPLSTPSFSSATQAVASLDKAHASKSTVKLSSIAQVVVTHSSSGGVDFSDSVVLSSYLVERPSNSNLQLRRPKVLGPGANRKRPLLPTELNSHAEGVLRGQRALPKQDMEIHQEPQPPIVPDSDETAAKRQMVVVMNKPQAADATIPSLAAQPHRFAGHALHSTTQSTPLPFAAMSIGPQGAPEQVLRIKAALDPEHSYQSYSHAVPVDHDHVYDHTEPGTRQLPPSNAQPHGSPHTAEHGMQIQSFAGTKASTRASAGLTVRPRQQLFTDPLASPWDTFDDDEDGGVRAEATSLVASARSLLLPESATEALAKAMSKRTASLSAGATRSGGHQAVEPRRMARPSSTESETGRMLRDEDADSGDDRKGESMPRSHVLTVSSLGGKSIKSRQYGTRHVTKRRSRALAVSIGDGAGMRESISAPVLTTLTPLELDCSTKLSMSKTRSTTNHSITRDSQPLLIQAPSSHGPITHIDGFELRGEHAFESPLRLLPTRAASPPKKCTCSRSHEPDSLDGDFLSATNNYPPPQYHLDVTQNPSEDDDIGDRGRPTNHDARCASCSKLRDATDATIIVNATRELTLEPQPKEADVIAQALQEMPRRSEMMKRRNRYTRGKLS